MLPTVTNGLKSDILTGADQRAGFFMCGLEQVTFQFSKATTPLLREVSFHIAPGERVAMMGANGSGKSTIALLLAGLLKPTNGKVHLPSLQSGMLPVGLLFQNPDEQLIASTVERDVAVGLENLGVSPDEMKYRVTEILERFRIGHLQKRLVAELSGGEKVRVALAGVMITRPSLLILDEPDSYLDEVGKQILLAEFNRLYATNPEIAILHITQYRHIAAQYQRLVIVGSGAIIHDGAPQSILTPSAKLKHVQNVEAKQNVPVQSTLTVSKLAHRYDDQPVFENLSFTLKTGQVMAVVGSSGSGKSTLALVLCSLLKQSSGTIEVQNATQTPVTMLFQFPERQFFLSTCKQELIFGPKNYGRNPSDDEINQWLLQVGLDVPTYIGRDPLSLSGGEKRRLAFALPFGLPAQFIIFDEPTAGLDEAGVTSFYELVESLKRNGKGVIIISHDGETVKSLADSVLVLSPKQQPKLFSASNFFAGNHWQGMLSTF